MSSKSTPLIIIIDDDITDEYPLVDLLKISYDESNVHLFQEPNSGIKFIEDNLSRKQIVLLDIMFGDKPEGFKIFKSIIEKSSLVCFILMTGSIERLKPLELINVINGHAWYFVQRDQPFQQIMQVIKEAEFHQLTRVDGALEEWILWHNEADKNTPYLRTKDGQKYSLLDILHSIRVGDEFGKNIVAGILNLTIDLLARNKEVINTDK